MVEIKKETGEELYGLGGNCDCGQFCIEDFNYCPNCGESLVFLEED